MADVLAVLAVLAAIGYVWMVVPIRWFRAHKGRLPDVWI
jgi:hypothetical protein